MISLNVLGVPCAAIPPPTGPWTVVHARDNGEVRGGDFLGQMLDNGRNAEIADVPF